MLTPKRIPGLAWRPSRRRFLTGGAAGLGALALGGCDRVSNAPWFRDVAEAAEGVTRTVQRALISRQALAREFTVADVSPVFKANGSTYPDNPDYDAWVADKFSSWRLSVTGLVEKPLSLSLADLKAMPARSQITRHDCVEGWSCIGQWKGPTLASVLDRAQPKPNARYIVFQCADDLQASFFLNAYYESIDLIDAYHPQTILAYEMNGQPLPVPHGAPLRLRVERQLGYKMAKYLTEIQVVDSFAALGSGKGGFWEDLGYEWYAGI